MKYCKVCSSSQTVLFIPNWIRCLSCGSDSNLANWNQVKNSYQDNYIENEVKLSGGLSIREKELTDNIEWIDVHYKHLCPSLDFLDIGCCEGSMLKLMKARGWNVSGFDIIEDCKMNYDLEIYPFFSHHLFNKRFGCVQAREVLEHVPGWRQFLEECYNVLLPNGLLQLQTPRPYLEYHPIPYNNLHLQIFSPTRLELEFHKFSFKVIDSKLWHLGQAWLLQRV